MKNPFIVDERKLIYPDHDAAGEGYTEKMNAEYNWMAGVYDLFIFLFPFWKWWIGKAIPFIQGSRVLEVSFGSGYLMSKYGRDRSLQISGLDYNEKMIDKTAKKLAKKGISADLCQGNVESLPYPDNSFDTVINTMAMTGYPDGEKAMAELHRVLKPGGRLILVDFDYPENRNLLGFSFVRLWVAFGDIVKDIHVLVQKAGFLSTHYTLGGFGSVHMYICEK